MGTLSGYRSAGLLIVLASLVAEAQAPGAQASVVTAGGLRVVFYMVFLLKTCRIFQTGD